MMMKMVNLSCCVFILQGTLFAQSMGPIQAAGSGCPAGTTSFTLSPDNQSVSILFDNYIVTTDANSSVARRSCAIAIPLEVLPGQQIKFVRADYRGFNHLPNGTESRFSVEYFLAGSSTTPYVRVFEGPLSEDYLIQDGLDTSNIQWSGCGKPLIFRINSDVAVYKQNSTEDPMTAVDSADLTVHDQNMSFYFVVRTCGYTSSSGASPVTYAWFVVVPLLSLLF